MKRFVCILALIFGLVGFIPTSHAAYPTTTEHHKLYPYTSVMASPYSCDNTGVLDIAASIELIKANQSNVGTIYFPHGTYKLATNLTIPAGMRIEREAGAKLSINTGIVLTFNGDLQEIGESFFTLNGTARVDFSSNTIIKSLPPGTWPITTNTTFSNALRISPGCIFSIPTGVTLTINGPLDAGLYQIFSCTGTGKVVFGNGGREVLPEWWGAVGNATVDCTVAIQAAFDSLPAGNIPGDAGPHAGTVRFGDGTYKTTGTVYFYPGMKIIGNGIEASVIKNSTTGCSWDTLAAAPSVAGSGARVTIRDLTLYGTNTATGGFALNLDNGTDHDSSMSSVQNVFIVKGYNGINLGSMTLGYVENVRVNECVNDSFYNAGDTNAVTLKNCYANHGGGHGFNLLLTYSTLINCAADGNGGDGYHFYASSISRYNSNNTYISCGSEGNSGNGIFCELGQDLTFFGLYVIFADGDSIKFSGTQNVTIAGFSDTGAGSNLSLNVIIDPTYGTVPAGILLLTQGYLGASGLGGDSMSGIAGKKYVTTLGGYMQGLQIGNPGDGYPFYLSQKGKLYPDLVGRGDGSWRVYDPDHGQDVRMGTIFIPVDTLTTGATTTLTGAIPAGLSVISITSRVTETITTTDGATGWEIGISGTLDKYGTGLSLTAGQPGGPTKMPAVTPVLTYPTATDLIITALAGGKTFTGGAGNGKIIISVNYLASGNPVQ